MGELQKRDREILYHVFRYRISINPVLQELFFKDVQTRNSILQKLRKNGALDVHEKAFGENRGMSYYFLTEAFIHQNALPQSRAKPLNEQALNTSLAVLGFCCLSGKERLRIEPDDVRALLCEQPSLELFDESREAVADNGVFVIDGTGSGAAIFEVYVPSPTRSVEQIIGHLEERTGRARASGTLQQPLKHRQYGFAVLVDHERKAAELLRRIDRHGMQRHARMLVECAPTTSTVQGFLRMRGQNLKHKATDR